MRTWTIVFVVYTHATVVRNKTGVQQYGNEGVELLAILQTVAAVLRPHQVGCLYLLNLQQSLLNYAVLTALLGTSECVESRCGRSSRTLQRRERHVRCSREALGCRPSEAYAPKYDPGRGVGPSSRTTASGRLGA